MNPNEYDRFIFNTARRNGKSVFREAFEYAFFAEDNPTYKMRENWIDAGLVLVEPIEISHYDLMVVTNEDVEEINEDVEEINDYFRQLRNIVVEEDLDYRSIHISNTIPVITTLVA